MLDQDYSFFGFSCTWCKYKCTRKNDMQKHMLTLKHKKNVERVEQLTCFEQKVANAMWSEINLCVLNAVRQSGYLPRQFNLQRVTEAVIVDFHVAMLFNPATICHSSHQCASSCICVHDITFW